MAQFELTMPKMGESVAEATITNWLKNVGDFIEEDEGVLEIATDKVDSEVPSPVEGKLVKLLFNTDDVVQVGQAIAIIETEGEGSVEVPTESSNNAAAVVEAPVEVEKIMETVSEVSEAIASTEIVKNSNGRFYSPLVRSIAKAEGINQTELDAISGSGLEGRVTKKDILSFIENRGSAPAKKQDIAVAKAPAKVAAPAPVELGTGDEIIEMDRMRKLIADHMVMSKQTSPHVTSFVEADVTNIVNWRNKIKDSYLKREGQKMTFTPIFIEAIVKAIKDYPLINVSVDGTNIIKKRDINIGMAAALPTGNLIVPVIKQADNLNLNGLTKQVNDLANRARNNVLKPDDIAGGTYTVTNVGTFGNISGTPIINQPQVAILALGAIRKMPSVIETPEGDFIGIRHKMILSHAYDHRVVDGALGGLFVKRVAEYLEAFDPNREV